MKLTNYLQLGEKAATIISFRSLVDTKKLEIPCVGSLIIKLYNEWYKITCCFDVNNCETRKNNLFFKHGNGPTTGVRSRLNTAS